MVGWGVEVCGCAIVIFFFFSLLNKVRSSHGCHQRELAEGGVAAANGRSCEILAVRECELVGYGGLAW